MPRALARVGRTLALAAIAAGTIPASADASDRTDPGPRPAPNCVKRMTTPPKFTDVYVPPRVFWYCPKRLPNLTKRQAARAARAEALHVAVSVPNAYNAGVKSCRRRSRLAFGCITFFDAEGHIRCTQAYRVQRTEVGVDARYLSGTTHCARSPKARF